VNMNIGRDTTCLGSVALDLYSVALPTRESKVDVVGFKNLDVI